MSLYQLHHIETPRLLIRPVQLNDVTGLHQSIERSAKELRRWMPWAKETDFAATQHFIQSNFERWQEETSKDFPLIVIDKATNTIISVSGFNEHTDLLRPCFEIGYWIDSAYTGKGLATELVNALTRYAIEGLNAIRVQICTQPENEKSTAVAKRCGYIYEAKLKNICIDCTSRLPSDGLLFSCCDTALLPPLVVTWKQNPREASAKQLNENAAHQILPYAEKIPTIQTKRLCLRAPRMQDNEKLYTALMASISEVSPWFPWAKKELTRRQLQRHLNEGIAAGADILGAEHVFFLIWDRNQENIIGEVWWKVIDWAVPNLQISYWLDTRYSGQGYAFEAVATVIKHAFAKRNAKCIQLYISQKNPRSVHLARKLGFEHEGTLKNYVRNFVTNEVSSAEMFSMTDFSQLQKLVSL